MRRPPGSRGDFFENIEPLFNRSRRPPDLTQFRVPPHLTRNLVLVALVILLLVFLGPVIGAYTDLLWFHRLGYDSLFLTPLSWQLRLGIGGFLVALLALVGNAAVALRASAPQKLAAIGVQAPGLPRPLRRLALAGTAVVAVFFGLIASGAWQDFALAFNAVSFNRTDPQFHNDISFYVFTLPVLSFGWGWLLGLLIVSAVVAVVLHASALGGGEWSGLPRAAIGHLSALGAAFFALLAFHYWLAPFGLLTSRNGAVVGAGFTDVNVRIPVYFLMLLLCAGLALLLLANIVLRRQAPLVAAPLAWVVALVVAVGIIPAVVQALIVKPAELSQESQFLQREIDSTNLAYALDRVASRDFTDAAKVTPDLLAANPGTVNNLRLWDYTPLKNAYNQIQTIQSYYDFNDVDIDRYVLPSGYQQVMLSARELSPDKLQTSAQTWVNLHLKYTHGYGAAATPVTQVANEGQPALVLSDIPPTGDIRLDQPQLYFGETARDYVVVDSREPEFDYKKGDTESYTSWKSDLGIKLDSVITRAAFAARFRDLNLLISSQVTSDSQVLFHRAITERINTLAPFLTLDHDPYLVIVGGHMSWIQDAYTITDAYPYSERYGSINPDQAPANDYNYIRNSVKVVMDAYSGAVTFYNADNTDPIIQAYSRVYPGVFKPLSDMPSALHDHVRYPEDFFTAQAKALETYHMHNPSDFFIKGDAWADATEVSSPGGSAARLQPYYVVMKLPGEAKEEFVLIQPFTPFNKNNLVAWLAARSDGSEYGKLFSFRFPSDRQVVGPAQVESRINQDPTISSQFTLLDQHGSTVNRGNLLVIPIGDAILYVEPVYIESASTPIPELKFVILADDQRVVKGTTLQDALTQLVGQEVAAPGGGTSPSPSPGTPSTNPAIADLIARANALYLDAQARLKAGDLAGYQKDVDAIGDLLRQIAAAGGLPASPSPGATPRATPSPGATPKATPSP